MDPDKVRAMRNRRKRTKTTSHADGRKGAFKAPLKRAAREEKKTALSLFASARRLLDTSLSLSREAEETASSTPSGCRSGREERERDRARLCGKRDERRREREAPIDGFLFAMALSSPHPSLPRLFTNDKTAPPLLPPQLALLDDQLRSARVEQQQLVHGRRAR